MTDTTAHPPIASRAEWLAARKALLTKERELTKARDAVNALRRRLPMVPRRQELRVRFTSNGEKSLLDLFDGRRQLVVYHFMFDPSWEKGCPGCTGFVDSMGDTASLLNARDTTFTVIARAPLEKLQRYRAMKGWKQELVSSNRTDFNYDFHTTQDETHRAGGAQLSRQSRARAARPGAFRTRREPRHERVLPHRRRDLPHVLDFRARHRGHCQRREHARPHAVRPAGRLRGFAGRLATASDVRLSSRSHPSAKRSAPVATARPSATSASMISASFADGGSSVASWLSSSAAGM